MKLAIVQDGLMCKAGGEQVALLFHKAFPSAPIFTLSYNPEKCFSEFREADVRPSWFQLISNNENVAKRLFFPLGLLAAKTIDVRAYDIILMSATHCAKYVRVSPKAKVICYAHNPFRLAWYPEEYKQYKQSKGLKRFLFDKIIKTLQIVDKASIKKINFLITNSNLVKERLKNIYDNYQGDITVVNPAVQIDNFNISKNKRDYFLIVSRLEYYKRVDLVIDAFNELGLPLVIVGKGPLEEGFKTSAKNNITFLKDVTTKELKNIYSEARAFIFPQIEDFGITALEANASGLPLIAFGKGGIQETQIPFVDTNVSNCTAIFFKEQSKQAIIDAVFLFQKIESQFCPEFIRNNAKKYSENQFIATIQKLVQEKSQL